jgi:predicted lipoprotein
MLRTVSKVDYFPVSTDGIDHLLESGTPIDKPYVTDQAASTQRGLGAVEHLLFGPPSVDPAGAPCDLAVAASAVIATEVAALHDAWAVSHDGGPPYGETFSTTMSTDNALADAVGAIVETLKQQSLLQIGKALGESAPEPDPTALDEGEAGFGAASYAAQLEGIRAWLEAGDESSLMTLIEARSSEVASEIDAHLTSAMAGLESIDGTLADAAAAGSPELVAVYEDLNALRVLFEADVVSLLDITLGFSDTDGDSG